MAYADLVVADGATHYWKLNETSGLVAADAVGSAPGTITGGVTLGVPGAISGGTTGMTFDGTTGKAVTAASVTIPLACTIEVWLKYTAVNALWLSTRGAGTTGDVVYVGVEVGHLYFFAVGIEVRGTRNDLNTGLWHHCVYVLSGTTCTLYVDGVVDGTSALTRTTPSAGTLKLAWDEIGNNFWNGQIDEVAIYPSALTPAQIRAHYLAGFGPYAQAVVADGASNYWRLDEPTGTVAADLVGSAPGTISGGVTLNQTGAVDSGKAMTFDGVNAVITAAGATTPQSIVSVEAWVKRAGVGGGSAPRIFSSQPSFKLELADGGGNITYYLTFTDASNTTFQVTGVPLPLNQWVHVVLTFDAAAVKVYGNGVLLHTATTWAGKTLAVGSGVSMGFAGQTFNGVIDDIAIYPRALTPGQIAQHYTLGRGTYSNRVQADGASNFWKLDEASGTVAVDSIGGANGTISGGVTLAQPGAVSGGKAMLFDGATGQIATVSTNLVTQRICTIEFWGKSTKRNPAFMTACATRQGGASGFIFVGFNAGANVHAFFYNDGSASNQIREGTREVADGKWHHCVCVFDGTNGLIYVDGTLDTSGPSDRPAPGGADGVFLGREIVAGREWLGSLDNVAIYPLALTAAQIADHFTAGRTATWPAVPSWDLLGDDLVNNPSNLWEPITPSDGADFKRGLTIGVWVGSGGDISAVTQSGVATVFAAVPAGAWLPLAAKRINATGTTATGLVALYRV